jgi:hypothetical protein
MAILLLPMRISAMALERQTPFSRKTRAPALLPFFKTCLNFEIKIQADPELA